MTTKPLELNLICSSSLEAVSIKSVLELLKVAANPAIHGNQLEDGRLGHVFPELDLDQSVEVGLRREKSDF